jgi:hypothetical protein
MRLSEGSDLNLFMATDTLLRAVRVTITNHRTHARTDVGVLVRPP